MMRPQVDFFAGRSTLFWKADSDLMLSSLVVISFLITVFVTIAFATPAFAATTSAQTAKPKTSVADLRYGVALYHYYQQDYLQSLSELMVADARDGIHGHDDNPELIAGGVSLAFGMQTHAEKVFSELLQDNPASGVRRPQNVRDAAWFYLGKLQYARSDWAAASLSFDRVSNQFNADVLSEMHALQINLQIKNNDFSSYSLKKIEEGNLANWEPYTLYNLGAAHARSGNMNKAQKFFRALANSTTESEGMKRSEFLTLQDKTHTAIGYSLLEEKNYLWAAEEFQRVRLEGLESNQALLGYGWAAIAQEKYSDAIKPWQLLQKRSLLYPAAQEALLALPFAYEKLNAPGDALREYESAEQLLEKEMDLVRDMRATLTQGELLTLVGSKPVSSDELKALEEKNDPTTLTAVVTDDGQNWLKINNTSIIKTRSIYLRELFAGNEFQAGVLDLRDLLKLQKLLKNWQPKLIAYMELLEQKQVLRQLQELHLTQQSFGEKETKLLLKRDALLTRINAIKANDNYIALADEPTRKTYAAVERSETTLQRMKVAGQDTSEYEGRLQIVRGLLLWRAAQNFVAGLWENESAVQQIDVSLARIKTSREKVDQVTATGSDIQPMVLRIQYQQEQLQNQLTKIDLEITARSEQLRLQVDKRLENHEKRLNRYLAQAHLAIARLYDAALRTQGQ